MEHNLEDLLRRAQKVLDLNWTGEYTRPAPRLYPHQWSWDSAFIAIGNIHHRQDRAEQELLSLFRGQWHNGMLPHIVFHNPHAPYFPGAEIWHCHVSPHAPRDLETSGIVQPPIHATAAWWIYLHAQDQTQAKSFLAEIFPKLKAWHDYLYRERDPHHEALVYIRHPWESGMDDSPLWDSVFHAPPLDLTKFSASHRLDIRIVDPKDRPTHRDYTHYLDLVHLFRSLDYDEEKIQKASPFLVQDALFNTLLSQSEQDLAQIATILGKDGRPFQDRSRATADAVNQKLWDAEHGLYIDFDLVRNQTLEKHTAAGFTPMFAGIPSKERADQMLEYLNSKAFCPIHGTCYAVPTYDKKSSGFSSRQYWRGPIWLNINWILYHGLRRYGFHDYAQWVRQAIIDLPKTYGFYEYYDPDEGAGHGTEDFSWTAALLVDVLSETSP